MDVTAASLYGFSERPLFKESPKEDPASQKHCLVARLVRSCRGFVTHSSLGPNTCPHATGPWIPRNQKELGRVFWDPIKGVDLVLHVDDFLVVGEAQHLK